MQAFSQDQESNWTTSKFFTPLLDSKKTLFHEFTHYVTYVKIKLTESVIQLFQWIYMQFTIYSHVQVKGVII